MSAKVTLTFIALLPDFSKNRMLLIVRDDRSVFQAYTSGKFIAIESVPDNVPHDVIRRNADDKFSVIFGHDGKTYTNRTSLFRRRRKKVYMFKRDRVLLTIYGSVCTIRTNGKNGNSLRDKVIHAQADP